MLWRRVRHKYAPFTALTGFLLFPAACCRSTSKKKKKEREGHIQIVITWAAWPVFETQVSRWTARLLSTLEGMMPRPTPHPITEQNMFVLTSAAYHILTFKYWSNTALTWRVRLKGYFNILSFFSPCCHNPYRHSLELSMPWDAWWKKMEVPKSNNSESCGLHLHHAMM